MLSFASFLPHPPVIIPSVGSEKDRKITEKTIVAMEKIATDFQSKEIDTVVIVSPHSQLDYGRITLNISPVLNGNFNLFGDFKTLFSFKNDIKVLKQITEELEKEKFPFRLLNDNFLDHGVLVPLFFLMKNKKTLPKIVIIGYSYLDNKTHFEFGKILKKVFKETDKKISFIASGDLSHCSTENAPCEYSPKGKIFDEKIVSLVKEKKIEEIINLEKNLVENACECGFKSLLILLGVINDEKWKPEIISYEAPFGVGYLVLNIKLN
ncbi:MAG: AmmeMemoRadiSam system protein B [bacterium]|nr:AmmeMemoRadiSam system protein B [bacterium]